MGQTQSACNVSYNAPNISDGIMVVGAIDENGQQVVPLAGIAGMRNTAATSNQVANQAGSNYGACVDVWAPGKSIYSTWKTVGQQMAQPPTGDTHLPVSGTSMAAPHIAALAAYLNNLWNATSPGQLEGWVRQQMFQLGSTDQDSIGIRTANLTGARPVALPTAVFNVNGDTKDLTGVNAIAFGQAFTLRYEARGATTCNLTGYQNGAVWYQVVNFQTAYDWGTVASLGPGLYRWEVDCVSGAAKHNTASISVQINNPAPSTATWYVNQVAQPNGGTYYYTWGGAQAYFSYGSSQVTTCDLVVDMALPGGALAPWYSYPNLGPTFTWGYVAWNPGTYRYVINCYGGSSGPVSSTLWVVSQ